MVSAIQISEDGLGMLFSECEGMRDIVAWLDEQNSRPGLTELDAHLSSLNVNLEGLKKHIHYAERGYQRNIIKKTEHYEIVAITWRTGQGTDIHDHIGSDCAFLIVEGTATETIYELSDNNLAKPIGVRCYGLGDVCTANEPDIHRISNETDKNLINIHIYMPPLSEFSIYDAA